MKNENGDAGRREVEWAQDSALDCWRRAVMVSADASAVGAIISSQAQVLERSRANRDARLSNSIDSLVTEFNSAVAERATEFFRAWVRGLNHPEEFLSKYDRVDSMGNIYRPEFIFRDSDHGEGSAGSVVKLSRLDGSNRAVTLTLESPRGFTRSTEELQQAMDEGRLVFGSGAVEPHIKHYLVSP